MMHNLIRLSDLDRDDVRAHLEELFRDGPPLRIFIGTEKEEQEMKRILGWSGAAAYYRGTVRLTVGTIVFPSVPLDLRQDEKGAAAAAQREELTAQRRATLFNHTANQTADCAAQELAFTRVLITLPCVVQNTRTSELVLCTELIPEGRPLYYRATRAYGMSIYHREHDIRPGDLWIVFGDPEMFERLHGYGS